jgi:hypothetical protein
MPGLFKSFRTDPNLETDGKLFIYDEFQVRLRRAGGSNSKYSTEFINALKPHRNKTLGKLPADVQQEIKATVLVKGCYVEGTWETLVDGKFVKGVESESGEIVPATSANVLATLKLLPDLVTALTAECENMDRFLQEEALETAENLADGSSGS